MHIIPDTLCNGFPLQLREHGNNKHHGPTHGGACVKLLPDVDKRYIQLVQLINQPRKVTDIAADSVQTIDNNCFEFPLADTLHHALKIRPLQISAGKPFILKDHAACNILLPKHAADIVFAQFNLVTDAFTLAGKLGLPGVDGNFHRILSHAVPLLFHMVFCFPFRNTVQPSFKQAQ